MNYNLIALALFCLMVWFVFRPKPAPLSPVYQSGVVAFVIDGDTLILKGSRERLRLWGVDAPENGEHGAEQATALLNRVSNGQAVKYIEIEKDKYGRTVARVFLKSGLEVNKAMIESPHAKEYRRYSKGFYSR